MDRGTLGESIRELRVMHGLSQEALAREAGVSLNLVNKLERGVVRDPHYSTLWGIADALGTTADALMEEEAPELVPLG
jgi:transcriptional regulator with XRE-family HTH domain